MIPKALLFLLPVCVLFQSPASSGALDLAGAATLRQEKMLRAYTLERGMTSRIDLLEKLLAEDIVSTAAIIGLARQALVAPAPPDERIILISILGELYRKNDPFRLNASIISDLRKETISGTPAVARSATFALSRTGGVADIVSVLARARSSGVIGEDDHAGELAHNFISAGRNADEVLGALVACRNRYGNGILFDGLNSVAAVSRYSEPTKRMLAMLLENSEPDFSIAIGEFGYFRANEYSAWLHSSALVHAATGGRNYREFVLRTITKPGVDPRKLLAYLGAPESDQFLKSIRREELDGARAKMNAYVDSLPQNQNIRDAATIASHRIATSSRP